MMWLLSLLLFLSPIGTLLLLGLAVGACTARYRAISRALLKRGGAVGGIGAVLAALVLGIVVVYWAALGRMPRWFRR